MAETGLDEELLRDLVHRFYARAQADDLLGPVFEERVENWPTHLDRIAAFWSSVTLMTGRYHGRPVELHAPLQIGEAHFTRWMALFEETAREVCPPAAAAHVILCAERIARSLQAAVCDARSDPDAASPVR